MDITNLSKMYPNIIFGGISKKENKTLNMYNIERQQKVIPPAPPTSPVVSSVPAPEPVIQKEPEAPKKLELPKIEIKEPEPVKELPPQKVIYKTATCPPKGKRGFVSAKTEDEKKEAYLNKLKGFKDKTVAKRVEKVQEVINEKTKEEIKEEAKILRTRLKLINQAYLFAEEQKEELLKSDDINIKDENEE